MASIIRIKRSSVSGNPSTLGAGELAYSNLTDNGSNGGDRLYIGMGTETAGNAANHIVIGGKYFTDMLDHTPGTLTASSALIADSSSKLDNLKVDNLDLNGNTISSTDSNGNILLTPNGTGKTVITNAYIGDTSTSLAEYIYDTVGGAVTGTSGQIVITNSDAGNTSTLSLATTAVTAGSYGSATAIPTFTVDAYGRLTAAGTASITTSLGIAGDTGTDTIALASDTLTFVGGTGITSTVSAVGNSVTFDIDNTVATLTGTQTLTNKTISGASNTLSNIGNSSLTNSSVTINGTSVSLGASATVTAAAGTLTGTTLNATVVSSSLTSVGTIATGTWQGTDVGVAYGGTGTSDGSITGTGALTFTAGGTNTNVNLVPNGTGIVDVGGKRVGNAATPTQSTDLATKAYVDGLSNGLDIKQSVRAASTAALVVTYSNGSSGVGATLTNGSTMAAFALDGINLLAGDRVLIKDQLVALQNGIYTVTTVGTISTNWVLTRATDFDNSPSTEVGAGTFFFVEEGNTQADNGYVVNTDGSLVIGTSGITFSQFSGAGQITAGSGLSKSGNTIDVNVANGIEVSGDNVQLASTVAGAGLTYTTGVLAVGGTTDKITVSADAITIASTYAGQTSITTLGTVGTGTWNGTTIGATYGGTGVNNGSYTITLGGSVSTAGAFTTSGAYALTLTTTGATNVTLPTTGTLVNTAVTTLSSLASIGTITTGTWNATTIATGYGGTGLTSYTTGDLIYASATNTLSKRAAGTDGQMLQMNSSGVPVWGDIDGGTY